MSNAPMLQFVHRAKAMPTKRGAERRRHDFDEIYDEFNASAATEQAGRCSQCGVPFCQIHCPLHNNIPDWLLLTAEGRIKEAWEIASATNSFPEICGRICPQDKLCEGNCVIEKGFSSVTIGAVERYITETAFDNGWVKPPIPLQELKQSVGIIGAGPAGLAAAERLRQRGYQITIYDRYDRAGGLMIYGIPNFKLEKHIVHRREMLLRDAGITFVLDTNIGVDITLEEIRDRHDAVMIATGVYKSRELNLGDSDHLDGIIPALDYLTTANKLGLGDKISPQHKKNLSATGKNVVVIGGGDTAMDCVRTAIRQEATSVTCVYRRDRDNMPGSLREVDNAIEEGVVFEWLSQPCGFDGQERVTGVQCQKIHLGLPDATGRQVPEPVENSAYRLKADLVIKALGFDPEDLPSLFAEPRLKVSRRGTVSIDWKTMMTRLDDVFAAGDIVRGASLVVWAIRDGHDAAEQIDKHLVAKAALQHATIEKAS